MSVLLLPALIIALFFIYRTLYHRYWNRGLLVGLTFDRATAVEGEHAGLSEVIANYGFIPLHILQISFRTANGLRFENAENETVSDRTSVSDVFSLGRREKVTRSLDVRCEKRGYYRIIATSVQGHDLFSQQIHYIDRSQNTALSVLPGRLSPEHYDLPLSRLFGDIVVKSSLFEDNLSLRGIREYSETDPQSSVNWKATAHTGSLKVNLHDRTAGQRLVILLNTEAPSALFNGDLLEDSIRLAGTLADEACRWDIPVRLSSNAPDILTNSPRKTEFGASAQHCASILGLLARMDLTQPQAVFADVLAEELAETEEDRQGLCYIIISTSIREHSTTAIKHFAGEVSSVTWLSPVSPDMPEPTLSETDLSHIEYIRMVRR